MTSRKLLKTLNSQIVDGENNAVVCQQAYAIDQGNLVEVINALKTRYGPEIFLLPLSATSGGGGIFQRAAPQGGAIIGLQFTPTAHPAVSCARGHATVDTGLDQIVIDRDNHYIYAGAAITLDQLTQALAAELGPRYKVLGADLTSYSYAQVGATFMTGGMGPQRRYFSDSISEIALFDGAEVKTIGGDDLSHYAGTYGWTGIVCAVRCRFQKMPGNEIAFALPVNNTPAKLGKLLQHLAPYCFLQASTADVQNSHGQPAVILGIEHITTNAMAPMFAQGVDNIITRRAHQLAQKCTDANADGLVFVNGFVDTDIDEFLFQLVDNPDIEPLSIADINLEHSEIFKDPEQMRAVREAVPFAARTQAPAGRFIYKGHTDATIRLNIDSVESSMQRLWQSNEAYVSAVSDYFDCQPRVRGQILVYGHMNPYGVDPHNRLTFASDEQQAFTEAVDHVHRLRDQFLVALQDLCLNSGSEFIGGEKGAGSEHEMFDAFGGPDHAPAALKQKFKKQYQAIQSASPMFNWRALPPYIEC